MALAAAPDGGGSEVLYFFENYCDACHPEEEFATEFLALTGRRLQDQRFSYYNVATANGQAALNAAIDAYALDQPILLPLTIVDDEVFMGSTALREKLPAYIVQTLESTDSLLYYLSLTACSSCAEASAVLSSLPDEVEVKRGDHTLISKVRVVEVGIDRNPQMALALLDAFGVPEEKRLAPLVLSGGRYYQGVDAIRQFVDYRLPRGFALDTAVVTADEAALPVLRLGGNFLAGLVGGLNPCALSMLLLLLSVLIGLPGNPARPATGFLLGKLAAYLCIGTVFIELFQLWNPQWLTLAAKWLLTILLLGLAALSLWDAVAASRRRYGEVRNQLPAGLRRRLQGRIERLAGRGGRYAILAAAGLGVLVAAGEFLCAGQVYLATLLAGIQAGERPAYMLAALLVYCLGFMLPSVLVTVLVLRGRSALRVSAFFSAHMGAVKLVTALFFLAVLAFVWLS